MAVSEPIAIQLYVRFVSGVRYSYQRFQLDKVFEPRLAKLARYQDWTVFHFQSVIDPGVVSPIFSPNWNFSKKCTYWG